MICRFCKKEIDKQDAFEDKNKVGYYYCNEEHYKLQQNKIKYKAPKINNVGEPNERRILTDYIQEQYIKQGWDKHDINWKIITAQIKNMMDEDKNLTYSRIRYVLWYLIEIKEVNLFEEENFNGSILNLIPFSYQEAESYWKQTKAIKEAVKDLDYELSESYTVIKVNCNKNEKTLKWEDL